ncbi:discoidin domain-containing protein [Myxococcota bacterium]|nr:discoidin domain-containing protein [Myxococcota bacterium]
MLRVAAALACVLVAAAPVSAENDAHGRNVALGRPYTMDPAPNYTYSPDPGDAKQLTDGQHAPGNLWGDKSSVGWPSVGWKRTKPVTITIDLGSSQPIGGVSYKTAAGKAGVVWPASIFVLASDDGATWTELGDLVALSSKRSPPPAGGFAIHRFASAEIAGRGRYVRFMVDDGPGPYVFVDEIEVFAGSEAAARAPRPAAGPPALADGGPAYFAHARTRAGIQRATKRDLATARQRLADAEIDTVRRRFLGATLDTADEALAEMPTPDPASFRAILPMNEAQAAAFAVIGALDAEAGAPSLAAWAADPWAALAPDGAAPASAGVVRVAAANGEFRAGAINLRAAGERPLSVRLSIEGLPGGTNPSFIAVSSVAFTETAAGSPVAAALIPAPRDGDAYRVEVPAGVTRQVWLSFAPRDLPPDRHAGTIRARVEGGPSTELPVELRVFADPFPPATRLHVGGWDDTDSDDQYGVTPANVASLIAHLRERGVDSPWGTARALAFPKLDASGRITETPDTARFDRWIARWPGARRYLVFVNGKDDIAGVPRGTPGFAPAVGAWLRFWADHAKKRGVRPEQISLLLVDEPHRSDQEERVVAWATAVRASGAGIGVWQNPTRENPSEIPAAFLDATSQLCANRLLGKLGGASYWEFFRNQRTATRTIELYGAEGPAHALDPYSYYRLQAWHADAIGGNGIHFWAFADDGGASSWNEFAATRRSFTPLFLSRDDVTGGKHMEAIREGAEDYELLARLRERIEEVAHSNPSHPALDRARTLAQTAPARVLAAPGASEFVWSARKNRSAADAVRIEIGETLDALRGNAGVTPPPAEPGASR